MAGSSIFQLALACTALALSPAVAFASPCTDRVPPAQYVYEPVEPYTVERVSRTKLNALCAPWTPYFACADSVTNTIYIVYDVPADYWWCLMDHEKAHLNGWPGDHPPN